MRPDSYSPIYEFYAKELSNNRPENGRHKGELDPDFERLILAARKNFERNNSYKKSADSTQRQLDQVRSKLGTNFNDTEIPHSVRQAQAGQEATETFERSKWQKQFELAEAKYDSLNDESTDEEIVNAIFPPEFETDTTQGIVDGWDLGKAGKILDDEEWIMSLKIGRYDRDRRKQIYDAWLKTPRIKMILERAKKDNETFERLSK